MRMRVAGLIFCLWICSTLAVGAASARILKVLPEYLDEEGRHALSPSLYERDAYQEFLRKNPDKRAAMRFDVNWKAKKLHSETLVLRIELRSSGGDSATPLVLERNVRPGRFFSRWSSLVLKGEDYEKFGQLLAWRVTLWHGTELVAEQKSFLW